MSRPLLLKSGLDWRSLNKADGWIPFVRHAELFEIAARELKNDCYGMTLAQRVDVRDGDVFAYLGMASETVEAALRNMARYSRVFSEAFQVELELDGGSGTLNFTAQHPSLSEYRQASEFRLSLIVLACRSFTGKRITPRAVHFIHQRRRGMARFRRVIRVSGEVWPKPRADNLQQKGACHADHFRRPPAAGNPAQSRRRNSSPPAEAAP